MVYGVEENSEKSCRVRGIHAGHNKEASSILGKEELETWAVPSFWNARNSFIYDGRDTNPA